MPDGPKVLSVASLRHVSVRSLGITLHASCDVCVLQCEMKRVTLTVESHLPFSGAPLFVAESNSQTKIGDRGVVQLTK